MPLPLAQRTMQSIIDSIQASFRAYWCDRTEIRWDNDATAQPPAEFVRFNILHTPGGSGPAGIESGGVKRIRREGIITIQVFTEAGRSRDRSNELVDAALLWMETVPTAGAWYRNASPTEIGSDGSWYQVNCSCELIYETLRA